MGAAEEEDRTEAGEVSTVVEVVFTRAAEVTAADSAAAHRRRRSLAIRGVIPARRLPDMRGRVVIPLVLSAVQPVEE